MDQRNINTDAVRIHTLELSIADSLKRVRGSTNQEYRTMQSKKRTEWQSEIDEIKERHNDKRNGS